MDVIDIAIADTLSLGQYEQPVDREVRNDPPNLDRSLFLAFLFIITDADNVVGTASPYRLLDHITGGILALLEEVYFVYGTIYVSGKKYPLGHIPSQMCNNLRELKGCQQRSR